MEIGRARMVLIVMIEKQITAEKIQGVNASDRERGRDKTELTQVR